MSDDTTWMVEAACAGHNPDLWFSPGPGPSPDRSRAIAICTRCPVREECLEYALQHQIDEGVWGGVGSRERRRIAKQRRKLGLEPAPRGHGHGRHRH